MNLTNRILMLEHYLARSVKLLAFFTLLFFSVATFVKGFDSIQSEVASIVCFAVACTGILSTLLNYICITKEKLIFQKFFRRTTVLTKDIKNVSLEIHRDNEVLLLSMRDGKIKKLRIGQFYESDKLEHILTNLLEHGELLVEHKKSIKDTFMKIYVKLFLTTCLSMVVAFFVTLIVFKLLLKNFLLGISKFYMTLFVGVFFVSVFLIILNLFVGYVVKKYNK